MCNVFSVCLHVCMHVCICLDVVHLNVCLHVCLCVCACTLVVASEPSSTPRAPTGNMDRRIPADPANPASQEVVEPQAAGLQPTCMKLI